MDAQPFVAANSRQLRPQVLTTPDQDEPDIGLRIQDPEGGRDHYRRPHVAAHGIQGNRDRLNHIDQLSPNCAHGVARTTCDARGHSQPEMVYSPLGAIT